MNKFLILFLAVYLLGATEAKKDCPCPKIYLPVCGFDGKTYSNSCLARCSGVPIQFKGPCPSERFPVITPPERSCVCTKELNWVCGSDGRTYANPCLARCHQATIQFYGRC